MIRQRTVLSLLLVLALAGCSIQETLIVELEDLVVAEAVSYTHLTLPTNREV